MSLRILVNCLKTISDFSEQLGPIIHTWGSSLSNLALLYTLGDIMHKTPGPYVVSQQTLIEPLMRLAFCTILGLGLEKGGCNQEEKVMAACTEGNPGAGQQWK